MMLYLYQNKKIKYQQHELLKSKNNMITQILFHFSIVYKFDFLKNNTKLLHAKHSLIQKVKV